MSTPIEIAHMATVREALASLGYPSDVDMDSIYTKSLPPPEGYINCNLVIHCHDDSLDYSYSLWKAGDVKRPSYIDRVLWSLNDPGCIGHLIARLERIGLGGVAM